MDYVIVCKNGRRIYVGGVKEDFLKNGVLRLERNGTALVVNFNNILFYGKKEDVESCRFSETRL